MVGEIVGVPPFALGVDIHCRHARKEGPKICQLAPLSQGRKMVAIAAGEVRVLSRAGTSSKSLLLT